MANEGLPLGPIKYDKNFKNTLPEGGSIGKALVKKGTEDYNTEWGPSLPAVVPTEEFVIAMAISL